MFDTTDRSPRVALSDGMAGWNRTAEAKPLSDEMYPAETLLPLLQELDDITFDVIPPHVRAARSSAEE